MKHIDRNNPFGAIPKGAVWEALKQLGGSEMHLDYGGYDGEALRQFKLTGLIDSGVAFDLNSQIVKENQQRMPDRTHLELIKKGEKLPLEDGSVSSVTAIGVIEHIADQGAILSEFCRVLRKGGILIVAVPGKHLFSFMDMGNWKFVFPRSHKIVYSFVYSSESYRMRYVDCADGMFGDIETEKMWHQHFSKRVMTELLGGNGFTVVSCDGLGFFQRIISNIMFFMPRPIKRVCSKLHQLDARYFSQTELCFVAKKI